MTTLCSWAPHSHVTAARVELVLRRPCGHQRALVPSCPDHAAERMVAPMAPMLTACPDCGTINALSVVAGYPEALR